MEKYAPGFYVGESETYTASSANATNVSRLSSLEFLIMILFPDLIKLTNEKRLQ